MGNTNEPEKKCNNPNIIPVQDAATGNDPCPICLENLGNELCVHTTLCNHRFHTKCIKKNKKTCLPAV